MNDNPKHEATDDISADDELSDEVLDRAGGLEAALLVDRFLDRGDLDGQSVLLRVRRSGAMPAPEGRVKLRDVGLRETN